MSDERLNSNTASNYKITSKLSYYGTKIRVNFNGSCLKEDKVAHNQRKIVNIYIVYEISKKDSISNYPTLENCLFGAVRLTKNPDINKYKYSGYGIGSDKEGEFSFGTSGFGRNCIILGADLSSSSHANSKKKVLFFSLVKILYKEQMVQQFMQKNCIQLILIEVNKKILFEIAL